MPERTTKTNPPKSPKASALIDLGDANAIGGVVVLKRAQPIGKAGAVLGKISKLKGGVSVSALLGALRDKAAAPDRDSKAKVQPADDLTSDTTVTIKARRDNVGGTGTGVVNDGDSLAVIDIVKECNLNYLVDAIITGVAELRA